MKILNEKEQELVVGGNSYPTNDEIYVDDSNSVEEIQRRALARGTTDWDTSDVNGGG